MTKKKKEDLSHLDDPERDCERCGISVPYKYNLTPFGHLYCDDCLDVEEDVFCTEDEYYEGKK